MPLFRFVVLLLVLALAGCRFDAGIDAWEGVLDQDIDQDGDVAGDEVEEEDELAFPDEVDRVYDLTVVGNTLWLWAEDFGDDIPGPVLIPLSLVTEEADDPVEITGRPDLLDSNSELTWDGDAFWFTSEGDFARAELFQVETDGTVSATIPCPFSGSAECQGLAWDGNFLWTAEKDGTLVTRVDPVTGAAVGSPFAPWDDTTENIDFLFAEATDETSRALVVRNGRLYWVLSSSESVSQEQEVDFETGGANQSTIWHASDGERRIFTTAVPPAP